MVGRSIENYKILERLNRADAVGVYKAVDISLSRNVVVKSIENEVSHRPEIAEGFRYEAATLAKLAHPRIPTLYSMTAVDDELFMILEYAEGEKLDCILRRDETLSLEECVSIFEQIFDCLEYAHNAGIAHGWLKTSNILLTDKGNVKVLGFGTSEKFPAEMITDEKGFETGEYAYSKRTSENKIERENDIYALAAMIYETLTGKSLFDVEKGFNQKVPEAIETVISLALSPNAAEIFQSVSEFRNALLAAGFKSADDKTAFAIREKLAATHKSPEISAKEIGGEKPDNKDFSVCAIDFSQSEDDVLNRESDQLPISPSVSVGQSPQSYLSAKSGNKRYKIAGAAIFAVLVLHTVWQFSYIQSENLRTTEASLKVVPPFAPLTEIKTIEPPVESKKDDQPVEVKPVYRTKNADVINSTKTVQKAIYRLAEPVAPAPPASVKKKAAESKSERLRRAEKMLTGF